MICIMAFHAAVCELQNLLLMKSLKTSCFLQQLHVAMQHKASHVCTSYRVHPGLHSYHSSVAVFDTLLLRMPAISCAKFYALKHTGSYLTSPSKNYDDRCKPPAITLKAMQTSICRKKTSDAHRLPTMHGEALLAILAEPDKGKRHATDKRNHTYESCWLQAYLHQ